MIFYQLEEPSWDLPEEGMLKVPREKADCCLRRSQLKWRPDFQKAPLDLGWLGQDWRCWAPQAPSQVEKREWIADLKI